MCQVMSNLAQNSRATWNSSSANQLQLLFTSLCSLVNAGFHCKFLFEGAVNSD